MSMALPHSQTVQRQSPLSPTHFQHTAPSCADSATNTSTRRNLGFSNRPASSDITELVLTKHSPDAELLLLPMLAHLSRDTERWITWICDRKIDRDNLAAYGVDTDKLRIIYSDNLEDTHWILWEALNAGTSHTVIATPGKLSDDALIHFESAAGHGDSRGLFIRYR